MNNTFRARFFISQSSRDLELLTKINNYFGEGSINNNNNKDVLNYVINSYKEGLNIVIPHFEKYPIPPLTVSKSTVSEGIPSPWTFTVSSDANDHSASTDTSTLKDKSGFRFAAGTASDFEPCLADPLPAVTGAYHVVVQQDADNCLAIVEVQACTTPVDIFGGTTS